MSNIYFGFTSTPSYYKEDMVKRPSERWARQLYRFVGLAETEQDDHKKIVDLYAGAVKTHRLTLQGGPYAFVGVNFFEIPVTPTQHFPTPKQVGQMQFNDERPDHRITGTYEELNGREHPFTIEPDSNQLAIDTENPFILSHITTATKAYKQMDQSKLAEEMTHETRGNIPLNP